MLRFASGRSLLELSIVGYQFPQTMSGSGANWLRVEISARNEIENWKATDPCLETLDLPRLAEWLMELPQGVPSENPLEFTEPCLVFEAPPGKLRVYFDLELRPDWNHRRTGGELEVWVEFPLDDIDPHTAARAIMAAASRFPYRA